MKASITAADMLDTLAGPAKALHDYPNELSALIQKKEAMARQRHQQQQEAFELKLKLMRQELETLDAKYAADMLAYDRTSWWARGDRPKAPHTSQAYVGLVHLETYGRPKLNPLTSESRSCWILRSDIQKVEDWYAQAQRLPPQALMHLDPEQLSLYTRCCSGQLLQDVMKALETP